MERDLSSSILGPYLNCHPHHLPSKMRVQGTEDNSRFVKRMMLRTETGLVGKSGGTIS